MRICKTTTRGVLRHDRRKADPPHKSTLFPAAIGGLHARTGHVGLWGPVALVGYMHRDLVEKRAWILETEYKEGMTLAQLMPGPLAAQLAIYIGFVHHGVRGATLAGIAFVLPSFLMVLVIGMAYVNYVGLLWMRAVFYGIGACVLGIIATSAYKLTLKSVRSDKLLWAIYAFSASLTVLTKSESVFLFLGAGLLVWWLRVGPKSKAGGRLFSLTLAAPIAAMAAAASAADWPLLGQLGAFFAYAGSFVFGSGLAIVPFLYGGVVTEHGWLNDRQLLDAVAVAMITPGPAVITTGFIGYLVAGFWGEVVAALATFVPCCLLTVLPAAWFKNTASTRVLWLSWTV